MVMNHLFHNKNKKHEMFTDEQLSIISKLFKDLFIKHIFHKIGDMEMMKHLSITNFVDIIYILIQYI